MDKRIEVDHYDEIAKALMHLISSNLNQPDKFNVRALLGEIGSAIRTLIVNGYNAGNALTDYGKTVHKLHLDISILIEKNNGNFEIVIFEIKKIKRLGLKELSQLIGYCLVSRCKFGVLINVDNSVSRELSIILDADKDLTKIFRSINGETLEHQFGVMTWNSVTKSIEYSQSGTIKSIPDLVNNIENILDLERA